MSIPGGLPGTAAHWEALAKKFSLESQLIYSSDVNFQSGSKTHLEQFILLRAIYEVGRQSDFNTQRQREQWFKKHGLTCAAKVLRESTPWKQYIQSISNTNGSRPYDFANCGPFSLAHYYQVNPSRSSNSGKSSSEKIMLRTPVEMRTRSARRAARESEPQTPTRAPKGKPPPGSLSEYILGQDLGDDLGEDLGEELNDLHLNPQTPALINESQVSVTLTPASPISIEEAKHLWGSTNDEQFISSALILLLNALSMCCQDVTGHWVPERQSFTLAAGCKKAYEARVDGVFRSRTGDVKAIVEVKPCPRNLKVMEIRMQETAQMAAWICSDPPNVDQMRQGTGLERRLLISQDMNEVYLTFAEFNADYVEYVLGRQLQTDTFLYMHEYGPFDTRQGSHMRVLGHLALAFTIDESLRQQQ